ncbi:MAG: hypothetical protein ABIT38_03345 [Gemmatimonadaceae bacterium]
MSALTRYFFHTSLDRPSTWETIEWWESRRIVYNLVVGGAGLFTLAWGNFVWFAASGTLLGTPWQAPLAYGVAANICYTMGWPIELWLGRYLGNNTPRVGATIFRYGFVFSIGLTLLPAAVFTFASLGRFFFGGLR